MTTSIAIERETEQYANAWDIAARRLIAKAISEFAHEQLLKPEALETQERWQRFQLCTDNIRYTFKAQRLELDDWLVDEDSLEKSFGTEALNAATFILEFKDALGIRADLLPEYLNAITRTSYAAARRIAKERFEGLEERRLLSVKQLANASFQTIEGAMCAGHPVFVANADRRGFSAEEHERYAPELGPTFRLRWVAVRRERCVTACVGQSSYASFVQNELTPNERAQFEVSLSQQGAEPKDYEYVPVHPWQWRNRVAQLYARDLAIGEIFDLGEGHQLYRPQQSIRTMLSTDVEHRHYVKCSLGVINMGFSRGISPALPPRGAAVNRWIGEQLAGDAELKRLGFRLLREVCFVGVPPPTTTRSVASARMNIAGACD